MRKSLLFAVVCCMSLGIGQVNATVPTQTELAEAVRKGDVKLVQKLIKQGAPVNAKDREGKTPIFYTIYAEKTLYSTDEGETVYDCKQPYIHKGDYSDCFSSSKEHLKIAEILINNGANINENPKFSLLYTALKNPDKSVAKLLINKGANINIANSDDYFHDTPLHLAVQMNDIETAKLLINKGANIHAKNVLGNTPLYSATTKEMAELLVNNGAAINARNNEELTPLHQSGRYLYNEEVLSFLISQVEDIDMGAYPVTPLQKMVEDNNMAGAKLLIEHGANVNAKDSNGTPVIAYTTDKEMMDFLISKGAKTDNLITAIVLNDMDTAKDLINHKGGYNIKGANNQNALHYAAEYNNLEIAKMLIKKGVDVNAEDKNGKTPLHIAALKSDIKMVKLLVKNGANVNANNYGTAEPLYLAMFNKNDKNHKILKYLIKKGANVNTQMGNITALWAAANEGLEEVVEILLKNGADIYHKTDLASSPIEAVLSPNNTKDIDKTERMLKMMIKYGADIDMPRFHMPEYTPLLLTISQNDLEATKLLIKLGAKVNSPDIPASKYYVGTAVFNNNEDMVKLLLENNADVNAKDYQGKTALDDAQTDEMRQILISYGAKSSKDLKRP